MKAESTIRREIQRLKKLFNESATGEPRDGLIYEAQKTLEWVVGENNRQSPATFWKERSGR